MPPQPSESVVQQLQAENRALRIEVQKANLERDELRGKAGKPDPRIEKLENELRRLREELGRLREERDELLAGVNKALDQLERG